MKKRTRLRLIVALLVVIGAGTAIALSYGKIRGPERGIPTAKVTRGNVDLKVYTTGQLRTLNTALLMAPPVNGTLQIIHLAHTGEFVKAGDVVLQFDPSEQEYNMEQSQSLLDQADQQLRKTKADQDVTTANDNVALLHAKYDIRRAELDVSQNEMKSAIDAKKNDLALEEAKRRYAQLEQDVKSRAASATANLAVFQAQRAKAQLDIKMAQDRIASMTIKATISGMVARKANTNGLQIFITGMSVPEYQEGDQTFPGSTIASILDTSSMEVYCRVPEAARSDINQGDPAEIVVDALPDKKYPAKVKTIAVLASTGGGMFGGDTSRKFDAAFQLSEPDPRLRPGQTTHVIVQGAAITNVLYVPRQALFFRQGKPTVFIRAGRGFEPKSVTIKHMTESQVVVEGLDEGTEVALVDPEAAGASGPTKSSASPASATKSGGK
jgi:HlyD family secretion protein